MGASDDRTAYFMATPTSSLDRLARVTKRPPAGTDGRWPGAFGAFTGRSALRNLCRRSYRRFILSAAAAAKGRSATDPSVIPVSSSSGVAGSVPSTARATVSAPKISVGT